MVPMADTLPASSAKSEFAETIRTVIMAVLLAFVFRSFAYELFHIPSGSMKANLLIGDYLFVSKYSYGYSRYSFPGGLSIFEGRMGGAAPKRGDVIVFRKPSDPGVDYIKRLIGLPGDRIQMKHGVLYINETAIPKKRIEDFKEYDEASRTYLSIPRYEETLPEGKVIEVLDQEDEGFLDNTPVYEVPEGHYFMMGDNRDNSADSRVLDAVGYVPAENLVGRADLILFSTAGMLRFRLDRFVKFIH